MSDDKTLAAVSRLVDLLTVIATVTAEVQKASALIVNARAEGRDISAEEWAQLDADLDAARERARAAIS